MSAEKFSAVMGVLVPQVVLRIMDKYPYDEVTAISEFYQSGVYAVLEREETKVWHLSPLSLFMMFDEEKQTGKFTFPEEV